MATTIDADVAAIRTAIYGRDVREAIASGLEKTYSHTDSQVSEARAAASEAREAAANLSEFTSAEITTILNDVFGSP